MTRPFDAVLVVAFGGPEGPDDVRPFLANVLRGRRVPAERVEAVAKHYDLFGGVSPLTAITRRQADGLKTRLVARGIDVPVYLGMRNWHPLLPETVGEMAAAGVRRAVGFICAAHRSYSSCTQYRQNVTDARGAVVGQGGRDVEVTYVADWHLAPGFINSNAANVATARGRLPEAVRAGARLVFTAHSIPESMGGAAGYKRQLLESAARVAERAGMADWALVFQSRSGRPEDPWLGPDVNDYLRAEHAAGLAAAVLCPIGFLCDHVEVLYDLDHEAADTCRDLGLPMARAAAVNDAPAFLDMMADVVEQTWRRYQHGVPLPIVSAAPPERVEGPPPSAGRPSRPVS
ncbi:MAG: ferrochelatase [Vicinamibacterales bacterium]